MSFSETVNTPLGTMTVVADDEAIIRVSFTEGADINPNGLTNRACAQLVEYFDLQRTEFDIPLNPIGTKFQQSVWEELRKIPSGQTVSYGDIARKIGKPKAARAVGGAIGSNPIAVVIPCHRVVASDGSITGYTGGEGIVTKQKLLDLETID